MKISKNIWLPLILSLFVSTQTFAQDKKPTPEERAYQFRHALFETYAWKMGQLVGSKMKSDEAAFKKHATDLQNLASMLEEGFQIKDSIPDGSNAKAEIWKDFAKFEEKANDFRSAAASLSEDGAMENFNPREFGSKNCGGCHRDFKVKD